MKVTVELDELVELHSTAKLSEYRQAEMERVKKETANLAVECERLAKENNNLRCELSTRPMTRELLPVTKTGINNAKEVLAAHYCPITSEDKLADETVPGDRFHTVYNALRDLVSRLEQEGLS
jgi:hypothetical protein